VPDHLTYGRYLHLDELLAAQTPLSHPEAHDELLFIIQHQTSELWLKLALHELTGAYDDLAGDDVSLVQKRLARVKQVQRQLIEQWSVLATLTTRRRGPCSPRRWSGAASTTSSCTCSPGAATPCRPTCRRGTRASPTARTRAPSASAPARAGRPGRRSCAASST
jgi:hypothetical protein